MVIGTNNREQHTRRFSALAGLVATVALSVFALADAKLQIKAPAFASGGTIPVQYTCAGANISPQLIWSGAPPQTKSLALIVDDPDAPAGTWVHWVIYNLKPSLHELPEHFGIGETASNGARQGLNDFSKPGYGGPCPPPGSPHRYYFRLYALDSVLNLRGQVDRKQLDAAMKGHVLAEAEYMGRFGR